MISVSMVKANVYEVISGSGDGDRFRVTMSQELYRDLCGLSVTHEWLIVQAFNFLMEQDNWKDKISEDFDLSELVSIYSDFESSLKIRLGC